jgi:steroid delta-isomerase-like uncharacterized protein
MSLATPFLVLACTASTADVTEQNKELVRQFVEAGNARDFAALDSLLTDDFTRHSQATPDVVVQDRDQFRTFLRQDSATFPDSRVTMQQLVAEDDLVAFHANYVGTQEGPMGPFPASGRQMDIEFFGVFRIEDDRIAELWLTWDNLSALAQLGHWPPAAETDSAGQG